jgi:phage shock protein A
LENYNKHIEKLKNEMNEATESAENIRRDIKELRNKYTQRMTTQKQSNST